MTGILLGFTASQSCESEMIQAGPEADGRGLWSGTIVGARSREKCLARVS